MARLDVRRMRGPRTRVNLVVEIQSDYMRDIPTVLVAPLVATKQLKPYGDINPIVRIGEDEFAVRLEQMAGVSSAMLGDRIASLVEDEDRISAALNKLLYYV
jgi:hypothetical protein